jgi:hypothetical protein
MPLAIGQHVRKRPFAQDIGVVRCRTAQSDEASASTLLGEVEFRDDRAVIGQAGLDPLSECSDLCVANAGGEVGGPPASIERPAGC